MDSDDRVLLVEGQSDRHVVQHLCFRSESVPQFRTEEKGNIDQLLASIRPEVRVSDRKALGILLDANEDPNSRWRAVADRLKQESIEVPRSPESTGTLIDESSRSPRIGIWLMPDNRSPGELEDFVSEMIPEADPVWPRAQRYIEDIPEEERKFTGKKIQRAKLHAWLATREDPKLMGAAIRARDLQVDGPLSTTFADWLRRLFN